MSHCSSLSGQRILLVEDEYLLAFDMALALESLGAEVVGPAPTLVAAAAILDRGTAIDAAVLDVNLRGEMVYPLADQLLARGVPVLLATAYDDAVLPERFRSLPNCTKPLRAAQLEAMLVQILQPVNLSVA